MLSCQTNQLIYSHVAVSTSINDCGGSKVRPVLKPNVGFAGIVTQNANNCLLLLKHAIRHHDRPLKYRRKELYYLTAQHIYRTQTFAITDDDIKARIELGFTPFIDFKSS